MLSYPKCTTVNNLILRALKPAQLYLSPKIELVESNSLMSEESKPLDFKLPESFPKDLKWSNNQGSHFILAVKCLFCNGSGRNPIHLSYSDVNLQEMKCKECEGRGYSSQFVCFSELWNFMEPYVTAHIESHLPEIIRRAKMELVQEIMES